MEHPANPAAGAGGIESPPADELMTPAEVAALFRVDPKTVTRWATGGKLTSLRTLGGHRRYHAKQVYALLARARGGADAGGAGRSSDGAPNTTGEGSAP